MSRIKDVGILKKCISRLSTMSDREVKNLYLCYSDEAAAEWLTIDEENLDNFCDWLKDTDGYTFFRLDSISRATK